MNRRLTRRYRRRISRSCNRLRNFVARLKRCGSPACQSRLPLARNLRNACIRNVKRIRACRRNAACIAAVRESVQQEVSQMQSSSGVLSQSSVAPTGVPTSRSGSAGILSVSAAVLAIVVVLASML